MSPSSSNDSTFSLLCTIFFLIAVVLFFLDICATSSQSAKSNITELTLPLHHTFHFSLTSEIIVIHHPLVSTLNFATPHNCVSSSPGTWQTKCLLFTVTVPKNWMICSWEGPRSVQIKTNTFDFFGQLRQPHSTWALKRVNIFHPHELISNARISAKRVNTAETSTFFMRTFFSNPWHDACLFGSIFSRNSCRMNWTATNAVMWDPTMKLVSYAGFRMRISCDCATTLTVSENCVAVSGFHGCDCGKSTRSNERKYLHRKAHITQTRPFQNSLVSAKTWWRPPNALGLSLGSTFET